LVLQNIQNKGVIYQNIHNKGLNPKFDRFCPVFAGKIFQINELLVVKELSPGKSGAFFLPWFYFTKWGETNGQVFAGW
jgi:hypothetical protein